MEAGGFGALRSALHRRPSAPLYKKICALVGQDDDTQLDYARAIMDRAWPDALRVAHLTPRPDPHERRELLLARAWHVMGTPAIIDRLAAHDLPPPPVIKLIAPRRYGYIEMALDPTALLAALPILPDHLDLSGQPIWGGELPGLLDALRDRPLRRLSIDARHQGEAELHALLNLSGPRDLDVTLGPWHLKQLQPARPSARITLTIHDDDDRHGPASPDSLDPLLELGWRLHALDSGVTLDDERLLALITTPNLACLTATWRPGEEVDEVLAALAGLGCSATLEVHATPRLIERALAGALPLPRHTMALRFRNHHDDQLFDRLQRRYPPGALTCSSEGAGRYAVYEDEYDYDRRATAWWQEREAWLGRGALDPDGMFARTQRALSGDAKLHMDQALDEHWRR